MHSLAAPAAAFAALTLSAATASATSTVDCAATDDSGVLVEMNLSDSLPVDRPDWVRIDAGAKKWSTLGAETGWMPAAILQSYDDGTLLSLDISDDQQSETVARVRILSVMEGGKYVRVGVLHILGQSVHPLSCDYGD